MTCKPTPFDVAESDWADKRVTVLGLGRHGGGEGAVRYLAKQGALVTVCDTAHQSQLADTLSRLRDVPLVKLKLGTHDPDDLAAADVIVVNPAVRVDHPCLRIARDAGIGITSEIELFLRTCPASIIGISGSNGKSTTSAMLAAILAADRRRTWLGGNIGGSLLDDTADMTNADWVVLELSSFQLAHLSDSAPPPKYSVLTNCTANHLDWHIDLDHYMLAKQRLLGAPMGIVLNAHDETVSAWHGLARGRAVNSWPIDRIGRLHVAGNHNRQNAACAAAVAELAGVDPSVIIAALARYQGLEHRLQFVGEIAGRNFYNDSKSTTPDSTMAALNAMDRAVWLLAGGLAKGTAFDALGRAICQRASGVAVFGAARESLEASICAYGPGFPLHSTEHLREALAWCWNCSRAGDAILLSPACASHDQFPDFAARGAAFRRLVAELGATQQPRASRMACRSKRLVTRHYHR